MNAEKGFLFILQGCALHLHNMISEETNDTRYKHIETSANELCGTGKDYFFHRGYGSTLWK